MRLTTEAVPAIITAAGETIARAHQAVRGARAALEPLLTENAALKGQATQLDQADAGIDEAATKLRDVLALEEQPPATDPATPTEPATDPAAPSEEPANA